MALLYDLGVFSVLGTNAALGIGWTLTFYQTGTTTLRNTYPTASDAIAGTNPNTNPVVIGADGRIPAIWLIDTDYKVVLKDDAGVTKMTRDPCMGSLASVTSGAALADNTVTNAKLTQIATARFKGRVTAGTGNVEDMTGTEATTLLDAFTSTLKGLAPASGGGTTNFLRADGTWNAPPGGTVTSVSGAGTVSGLTLTGTVTTTGSITLGGTLSTTSSSISDFNSASRAQTEAELVAGTNVTITPSGTGATRQLTIAASGGGGTTTNALTMNNGGAGAVSGTTFDGSVARTISYNTVGATRAGAITSGDLTIATARLAGRTTAATGAIEEISIGANLSLSAGSLNLATSPSITTPTITGGTITPAATPTATDPGFIGLPQVSKTASYTLTMTDMFKEIYITGTTAAQTITIPANGSVAAPIGAFVTITNDSNQNWSIAITTDTLALSPGGTTGTRTLAANGTATIRKVTSTRWWIYGTGLT